MQQRVVTKSMFSSIQKGEFTRLSFQVEKNRTWEFKLALHSELSDKEREELSLIERTAPKELPTTISSYKQVQRIAAFCQRVKDYLPSSTFTADDWSGRLDVRKAMDVKSEVEKTADNVLVASAISGTAAAGLGVAAALTNPPSSDVAIYDAKADLAAASKTFAGMTIVFGGVAGVVKAWQWRTRKGNAKDEGKAKAKALDEAKADKAKAAKAKALDEAKADKAKATKPDEAEMDKIVSMAVEAALATQATEPDEAEMAKIISMAVEAAIEEKNRGR